jgi:hypothetical protein
LVGVDQAQAAVLHYNFDAEGAASGFFKVDNSSLTGIGEEYIAVSEGRLDTFLKLTYRDEEAKEYYNLAEGARAVFYQGDFLGLYASDGDVATDKYFYFVDEPYGSYSFYYSGFAEWSIDTRLRSDDEMWISYLTGQKEGYYTKGDNTGSGALLFERWFVYDRLVTYTLVNTEPSPVPEPLTAGGTALALAGLSWLKHKKKMAA